MPNWCGWRDFLEFAHGAFLEFAVARPTGPPPSLWDSGGNRCYGMSTHVTRRVHSGPNQLEALGMGGKEGPVPKLAALSSLSANREPNILPDYCVVAFMGNLLYANAAEEIGV